MESDVRPWVADMFWDKMRNSMGAVDAYFWSSLSREDFDRHLKLLEQLPRDHGFLAEQRHGLAAQLGDRDDLTEDQRARIQALLDGSERSTQDEAPEPVASP